jgi:hypothetical protein
MKTLDEIKNKKFPLTWANLDSYSESKGSKVEIYLVDKNNLIEGLLLMFYTLFGNVKSNIKLYSPSWWDFCLDTWDVKEDKYDYGLDGKSVESKDYLMMLKESAIDIDYSGICICNDWENFLKIILTCIIAHKAPYSHIFYDEECSYFFYFHHSGSIGFYYKIQNEVVENVLSIANNEYDVR